MIKQHDQMKTCHNHFGFCPVFNAKHISGNFLTLCEQLTEFFQLSNVTTLLFLFFSGGTILETWFDAFLVRSGGEKNTLV